MIHIQELQDRIEEMYAEPQSDEAKEVIHDDNTHVAEVWQDGEITSTKSGDLYGRRSLHQMEKPMLPEGQILFSRNALDDDELYHELINGKGNKKMVIVNDELRDILAEYRNFPVCQEVMEPFYEQSCPECDSDDWRLSHATTCYCNECDESFDFTRVLQE